MADYLVTDTELTSIADAIRTKGGTSASLTFPTGFVSAVNDIPSGGAAVTTVTFGEYAFAYFDLLTIYTDGDGVIHYTSEDSGNWGCGTEDQVDMLSGSTLVTLSGVSYEMSGAWVYSQITGLSLIKRGSFTNMKATTYYLIFQVD